MKGCPKLATNIQVRITPAPSTAQGVHRTTTLPWHSFQNHVAQPHFPPLFFSPSVFPGAGAQGKGADSAEADALLSKFVGEAWAVMAVGGTSGGVTAPAGLAPVSAVFAGLCCTHYGYSLPLWNKALAAGAASGAGGIDAAVATACVNPNSDMAAFIFKTCTRPKRTAPTDISIKVFFPGPRAAGGQGAQTRTSAEPAAGCYRQRRLSWPLAAPGCARVPCARGNVCARVGVVARWCPWCRSWPRWRPSPRSSRGPSGTASAPTRTRSTSSTTPSSSAGTRAPRAPSYHPHHTALSCLFSCLWAAPVLRETWASKIKKIAEKRKK